MADPCYVCRKAFFDDYQGISLCRDHYLAVLQKMLGDAAPVEIRLARSTGTKVSLYLENSEDGKWSTVCEDHGGIVYHQSKAVALSFLSHPEDWCPRCQGDVLS